MDTWKGINAIQNGNTTGGTADIAGSILSVFGGKIFGKFLGKLGELGGKVLSPIVRAIADDGAAEAGFDAGRFGNRLPNGNFTNLKPEDLPGPFKALNNSSLYRQPGTFNYVVRGDGSLVVASRAFGHVDLALGGEVQAAGDVTIEGGQITRLTNNSGHYRPYGDGPMSAAINAFGTQGGFVVDPAVYLEVPFP